MFLLLAVEINDGRNEESNENSEHHNSSFLNDAVEVNGDHEQEEDDNVEKGYHEIDVEEKLNDASVDIDAFDFVGRCGKEHSKYSLKFFSAAIFRYILLFLCF